MDHKHVKIGVCLDPNGIKMCRHIRYHDSEEVYMFNSDGFDPDAHNKHLREKIKSFKCSKAKFSEIDWYLFTPYLEEYIDSNGNFVFNAKQLRLERESPIYSSGKSLSLFSWKCLEYMSNFSKKHVQLSGAEKFRILQNEFAGNAAIQSLIFQHKSTGTWHSFVEVFDNHLKSEFCKCVAQREHQI